MVSGPGLGVQEGRVLSIQLLPESGDGPSCQRVWAQWTYSAVAVTGKSHALKPPPFFSYLTQRHMSMQYTAFAQEAVCFFFEVAVLEHTGGATAAPAPSQSC